MLHYDIILLRIGIIYKILHTRRRECTTCILVYVYVHLCLLDSESSVLLASVGPPPLALQAALGGFWRSSLLSLSSWRQIRTHFISELCLEAVIRQS